MKEEGRQHPGIPFFRAVAAGAAALLISCAAPAAADDLVSHLERGRTAFERICGRCHGTDKPDNRNMDRPAWDGLITSMEAKGAILTAEERELILDYLGIRNVFITKCTVCHTKEKVFDREQTFENWKKTVKEMAAKQPDLISAGEARSITAYLAVVLGMAGEKP